MLVMSKAESILSDALAVAFPNHRIEKQYRFHEVRRWRLDFAFPELHLAIEVNGAGFGHQHVGNQRKNWNKLNAAREMGWRVLEYPANAITVRTNGEPGKRLERIIAQIERTVFQVDSPECSAIVLEGD
jgi:very-short-patch-repair endonuclease